MRVQGKWRSQQMCQWKLWSTYKSKAYATEIQTENTKISTYFFQTLD